MKKNNLSYLRKTLYLYMNNYIYSDQLKWGLEHA